MDIVTGYRGESHITSEQDRAGNQGAIGTGSYIMNVGQKLITETISATEIRIRDGALCHQGCIGVIAAGAYDVVEIANGSQGMLRKDLIVCRYTKDAETNVESLELVAIQGTPAASNPSLPSYNSGNIQAGDTPVDMPLYQVNINGINIDSITKVASNVRTQAETDTLLGSTSISGVGNGTVTGALSTLNSNTVKSWGTSYDEVTTGMTSNDGWTATGDGIMTVLPTFDSSGSDAYVYVTDVTNNTIVCTISGKGTGLRASSAFPVKYGQKYKMSGTAHISTQRFYFMKFRY